MSTITERNRRRGKSFLRGILRPTLGTLSTEEAAAMLETWRMMYPGFRTSVDDLFEPPTAGEAAPSA